MQKKILNLEDEWWVKIILKKGRSPCLFKSKEPIFSLVSSASLETYYVLDMRDDAKKSCAVEMRNAKQGNDLKVIPSKKKL